MKIMLFFLCLPVAIVTGCSESMSSVQNPGDDNDSLKTSLAVYPKPQISYDTLKQTVKSDLTGFQKKWISGKTSRDTLLKRSGDYLTATLVQKIFPYWYGTEWDFNGITEKPGEGEIACGYFVSTTLRDAGFKINRYKVAQKHSFAIVKTLCSRYKSMSGYDAFVEYIKKQKDGIYVVGMDYHVGFIYKVKDQVIFIHSSYLDSGVVVQEPAETSQAFHATVVYVVGSLTDKNARLEKWGRGEIIPVVE